MSAERVEYERYYAVSAEKGFSSLEDFRLCETLDEALVAALAIMRRRGSVTIRIDDRRPK